MTYEQKFMAMKALGGGDCLSASVLMRCPGNWYVSLSRVSISDGHLMQSVGATGATPEAAIDKTWIELCVQYPKHVVAGTRRVNWNGYMWQDAILDNEVSR